MEQIDPEMQEDLGMGGKLKNWIQDNIRIIISVLIVVAIAGGIYSYSKRGEEMLTDEDLTAEETVGDEESAVAVVGEEESETAENENKEMEGKAEVTEEKAGEAEEQKETATEEQPKQEELQPVEEDVKINSEVEEKISEETAESFIETAVKGDSVTTLARKALKDYLEKNQDSSLTPEHKIYIEDYLRKNVDHQGGLTMGESISFSKILIKDGIEKAKTLNDLQLNNLKKYSARVSNL